MSIYDISAESSFKLYNYILIMWGNMFINLTKFITKIYNSVELFILDNTKIIMKGGDLSYIKPMK